MKNESIPLDTSKKPLNPKNLIDYEERARAYEELAPASNPARPAKAHELGPTIGPLLLQEYMAQKGLSPRARETFDALAQRMRWEISKNPRMADKLANLSFDDKLVTQLISRLEKISKASQLQDLKGSNLKEYYTSMYSQLEKALSDIIDQKYQASLDKAA